jgi:hypothetical protein
MHKYEILNGAFAYELIEILFLIGNCLYKQQKYKESLIYFKKSK